MRGPGGRIRRVLLCPAQLVHAGVERVGRARLDADGGCAAVDEPLGRAGGEKGLAHPLVGAGVLEPGLEQGDVAGLESGVRLLEVGGGVAVVGATAVEVEDDGVADQPLQVDALERRAAGDGVDGRIDVRADVLGQPDDARVGGVGDVVAGDLDPEVLEVGVLAVRPRCRRAGRRRCPG